MSDVVVADSTCAHTGSACNPPVAGTVTVGSNTHAKIDGTLVMVEDGTFEVPAHTASNCIDPDGPHSYSPDTFNQSHVKINGQRVIVVGDSYSPDPTEADSAGSNTHVSIS